jgi:His-Xaa-Ser system radical SAM maturase HxsC
VIPLSLPAESDAPRPFVTRLGGLGGSGDAISRLERAGDRASLWCGEEGLVEIHHESENLVGDVVLVEPARGRVERLLRARSRHNTLLVTEQCDQLCVMCSQPPKKTHNDRFEHFGKACLLADEGTVIGISGGEPTLHMAKLLQLIEGVVEKRADIAFHILSNGQHFDAAQVDRLRSPGYRNVVWGVPLYSADEATHDAIVGKPGAFRRLMLSFQHLFLAGARIELRTVLTSQNVDHLDNLAMFIAGYLPHIEQWSIMDLENAGFARKRFSQLRVSLPERFSELATAIDRAVLHGIPVRLFNIPLCHIPEAYRNFAVASISDWKQRFAEACDRCLARRDCSGFFEWYPDELVDEVQPL